jgi:hypothetical protein
MTGKEAYFKAKREVQMTIYRRLEKLEKQMNELEPTAENVDKHRFLKGKYEALEELNSFVRNVMLWNTEND